MYTKQRATTTTRDQGYHLQSNYPAETSYMAMLQSKLISYKIIFLLSCSSFRPFYGYHEDEQPFLKIYLYNPSMVKR